MNWFWQRRRPSGGVLALRSRGDLGDTTRVDFEELAPDIDTFLGQAAYLQLGFFETLSELIALTPELAQKESLSKAAGAALRKHEELVGVIRERGDDPTTLMLPFREPLDAFRRATHGVRPQETMLSVHITAGMLDDFYLALASSYGDTGRRVARILRADDDRQAIVEIIAETIASDVEWKSLLAMWGRRLVGDTLLIARAALRPTELRLADEEKVEPVFTELMAAHSRRMDAMGLAGRLRPQPILSRTRSCSSWVRRRRLISTSTGHVTTTGTTNAESHRSGFSSPTPCPGQDHPDQRGGGCADERSDRRTAQGAVRNQELEREADRCADDERKKNLHGSVESRYVARVRPRSRRVATLRCRARCRRGLPSGRCTRCPWCR